MAAMLRMILFLLLVPITMAEVGGRKSGPYNVEIEKFEQCEDSGSGQVVLGSRITKTRDGRYLFNNPMYFGVPFDEHIKMHLELQSLGNGGYRPRFMQHTLVGCEALWKHSKNTLVALMKSAGVTVENCPIPAGNYTTKDMEVKFQTDTIPVMLYNKYRMVILFFYKGVKVGCFMIYLELVPK